ncbi:MAG: nuclear transport factor 2 family protein [Proteobacteria bacterium]|nr:nuclear transport factor 2 family protein [Pseudomonadota bacterium]
MKASGIPEGAIADLLARDALRRLVTAYSRAIDRRDMAMLRSLYHDDACERHGRMFAGGPDAYVTWVEEALSKYAMTSHYVTNTSFFIEGDRGEGEIYKINYHRTHGPQAQETITGSRSFDIYRREGGCWRFQSRDIALDWATTRAVDESAYRDSAAASPPGQAGAADPSYLLLHHFSRFTKS